MKRRPALLLTLLCMAMSAHAQMKWNATYQAYIDQYKSIAVQEMQKYGIPASITLAQGIFESAAGRSDLARKGNNHFGIKCHGWAGRSVYHDDDAQQECFRAYDTVLESYEDHSKFLATSQRYRRLFSLARTDYAGWARGLKECGYATNPQYANKLIELIELYRLYEYDGGRMASVPQGSGHTVVQGVQQPAASGRHQLFIYNNNVYLRAHQGETFRTLADELGISYRKLARYNERNKKDILAEGDVVYLKKKRTHADKAFKHKEHVVQPGESMYTIAQSYGIRLKSLYRKNRLPNDYQPRVGDRLKVY
ncbi:MAG: glucosaminidase domain-containing protein [Prevotella sp.]|nr:glucosaminidase domain-containing protein [Prevotella sp.]